MTLVQGELKLVTDAPDEVSQVWIQAPKERLHGTGMITDGRASEQVKNGVVSFNALPGVAVMVLLVNGIPSLTKKLLVPDKANATLRECIEAVGLADDGTLSELESLSLEVARVAAQIASADRLESWASETASAAAQAQLSKDEANNAANRASGHQSNAEQAESNAKQAEANAKQHEIQAGSYKNATVALAQNASNAAASAADDVREELKDSIQGATESAAAAKTSETNAALHEANSLSAAERAEFAAEETIQQVEGDFATRNYVEDLVKDSVSASTADVARVIQGKNLYNPKADTLDAYLFSTGAPQSLANYRLTDFIPVVEGETYAMNVARHWAFFDAARVMIPESWDQNTTQQATVVTAPAGASFLRMSYAVGAWTPSMVQIEQGTTSTAYEPYQRVLDPSITVTSGGGGVSASPLRVVRDGDVVIVTSDLGGKPIAQEINLAMGRNSVLNFSRVTYNNALLTTLNDDVAPIRTQQGTVGANHGLALMARWTSGHGKTAADIGSVWTDGTSEFTIIDVDSGGKLFMGKAPAIVNGASTAPNSTPVSDLTHVSGATNTATIPLAGFAVTDQVAPWVQRKRQVVELDGVPLADGEARGHVLTMRESYEILDYGVIHAWVRANPGQRYTTTHHKAAVGVETEWRFTPGGKTRHHTALWEISPTTLGNTGFLQAIALPGDVTRYLPGVGVVGGLNWDSGVNLTNLTSNLKVTAGDLLDGRPPTVAVDIRSDLGMAIALTPWEGASESSTHLASTPANLFDLRSTKKMYPNVIGSIPPGWGRITATGIRAYLTPTEAEEIVADADPASAWVTLDQMSG